jgi:hypothetical protein
MRCILALLLFSALAFGQAPANQTTPDGYHNGRFWSSLALPQRTFYLVGHFDGFERALVELLDRNTQRSVLAVESLNVPHVQEGAMIAELDRFYADTENLNVPIWRAIRIAGLRLASRPAWELAAEMNTARAEVRNAWDQCEKKQFGCEHLR